MIIIIYEDIKIYHSNTKTLLFLESCVPHPLRISLGNKQPITSIFSCRTITHWYTDFRSYLDFHKMHDVQGFCLACHIFCKLTVREVQMEVYEMWQVLLPGDVFRGWVLYLVYKDVLDKNSMYMCAIHCTMIHILCCAMGTPSWWLLYRIITTHVPVTVSCKNQMLFCCIFQLHHHVWSAYCRTSVSPLGTALIWCHH